MTLAPWHAAMISPDQDFDGAPLLRKEFTLAEGHGAVATATLRATAYGIYQAVINGTPVGDDVLSPGWSSYEWRLRYRTYDVTALLEPSTVLGVELGNGWYRGRLAWHGLSGLYGSELGFFGQLDIEYADGHVQSVASDTTWQAGPSSTTANDLYDGQTIDARREPEGWDQPDFNAGVSGAADSAGAWIGGPRAGVRRRTAGGAGWPAGGARRRRQTGADPYLTQRQDPGGLRPEPGGLAALHRPGLGGARDHRAARRGAGGRRAGHPPAAHGQGRRHVHPVRRGGLFEPTKTFHGFRYAEISGWPGTLTAGSLEAVVVHSELERTGEFECSNPLVNQLHRNIVWGLKGNFLDLPTDCPQRDERLGWTGDIAVFAPTAAFLYDVKGFLQDWLLDLAAEQEAADGLVPITVPDALKYCPAPTRIPEPESSALWSEASVWVPWALWEALRR